MNVLGLMVALTGSFAAANIPEQPQWLQSYGEARSWAAERQKPLAVFIGSGVSGWEKVSKDGNFDPKVYQLLKEKYACVYIDTDTETGKALAKRFEVEGKGLVISDKTGNTQAFHHSGDLGPDLVAKALVRYSNVDLAAATEGTAELESPPAVQMASYSGSCNYGTLSGGCAAGSCNSGASYGCSTSSCNHKASYGCATSSCNSVASHGCSSSSCNSGRSTASCSTGSYSGCSTGSYSYGGYSGSYGGCSSGSCGAPSGGCSGGTCSRR
jgi:hypothetical protein